MKLFEFQGKKIFQEYGLPVPQGQLMTNDSEEVNIKPPVMLKAQILVGGRGKAGGIKICNEEKDLSLEMKNLFDKKIKGEAVNGILIEKKVELLNEFYLSLTFNKEAASPVLIASSAGGVDIEEIAKNEPEKIITVPFNLIQGPADYQVRYVADAIGYDNVRELKTFIDKLYQIFREYDANLVEINPLGETPEGLVALDSKVLLDEKSSFRQKELFADLLAEQKPLIKNNQSQISSDTITYVGLNGSIGLISDGAGTGMLTLDLIRDSGGEAANFCEMGGITNPEVMYKAIKTVMEKKPNIKSLLIVLIGGFNRMDEMAEGIIKYRKDYSLDIPLIVRMCGTLEDVGKEMMAEADIPVCDSLIKAVKDAVALTEGN